MADAILHVKDSYYFEIPKTLWSGYESVEEVPQFLRKAHPDAELEEFNHALEGKVLIPQPFGTPKNLYEPESGFCISKFMILELLVAGLILWIFSKLAKLEGTSKVPRGKFWNLFEGGLVFVRDHIARTAIGKHEGDRFVPLLWTLFFFILFCNLLGLVPMLGTATGSFGTTLALALVVVCTTIGSGIAKFGPIGFWTNFVPHMELPWWLFPLKVIVIAVLFVIEVAGMFIRHAVLGVRLLANMVAGHLVLFGIMGVIVGAATSSTGTWATAAFISVIGSTLFSCLEVFLAALQAYIFTFLAALFIGSAVHEH